MASKEQIIGEKGENLIKAIENGKFAEFMQELADSGHKLTVEDLNAERRKVGDDSRVIPIKETISDISPQAKLIFVPELWIDNMDTARELYDSQKHRLWLSKFDFEGFAGQAPKKRYKTELDANKRTILGRNSNDFFDNLLYACQRGTLPELRKKLNEAGYDFGKAELLYKARGKFPGIISQKGTYNESPAAYLDYLLPILEENGERLTVHEWKTAFLLNYENENIVSQIAKMGYAHVLFEPKLWINQTEEMAQLGQLLTEDKRKQIEFDNKLQEAESLSFPKFEIKEGLKKADLFTSNESGRSALQDTRVWQEFDKIISLLKSDHLTKSELLKNSPSGIIYIEIAARAGKLGDVRAYLEKRNEALTAQEISDAGLGKYYQENTRKLLANLGDIEKVKSLLAEGVDLEYKDSEGQNALIRAIGDYPEAAKFLINNGADVTADKKGWKVLAQAGYSGRPEIVELIIAKLEERFAQKPELLLWELTKKDSQGDTPLKDARDEKSKGLVKKAIEKAKSALVKKVAKLDYSEKFPEDKDTIFSLVVSTGNLEAVKTALSRIKELHKGDDQAIKEMLEKGNPRKVARDNNSPEIEQIIIDEQENYLVLAASDADFYNAAEEGKVGLVKKILEAGKLDINSKNGEYKWTPLLVACRYGHNEMVELLLKNVADPDARDSRKAPNTALTLAAAYATEQTAKLVLNSLKQKYTNDHLALFSALTVTNSDSKRAYNEAISAKKPSLAAEIKELVTNITMEIKWDAQLVSKLDAHEVFHSLGLKDLAAMLLPHKRVTIIGSGFSGTATAIELLSKASEYTEIIMVEKSEGRRSGGIAYSRETAGPEHLSNIPVSAMSPFYGRKSELYEWLRTADRSNWPRELKKVEIQESKAFPRQLMQLYMDYRLQQAIDSSKFGTVTKQTGTVVDLETENDKCRVIMENGEKFETNHVVLSTGLVKAKEAPFAKAIEGHFSYVSDPYTPEGKEAIKNINPHSTVMIMGTALSAYDSVVSLIKNGHQGKIIMASRHGYEHRPYGSKGPQSKPRFNKPEFMSAKTLPELVQGIRLDFWQKTVVGNYTPEQVLYAYQDYVPSLLERFPKEAIAKLLNNHESLIATSRVGVDTQVALVVQQAKISGQLTSVAINIHEMRPVGSEVLVRYTPSAASNPEEMRVDAVVSGLGRETGKDILWNRITEKGMVVDHFTGKGIQVEKDGQVIDKNGVASDLITAVGPMRAGDTFERTGAMGTVGASLYGIRKQLEGVTKNVRGKVAVSRAAFEGNLNAPEKMILSSAFTGVRYNPDRIKDSKGQPVEILPNFLAENMPITPEEMAHDALEVYKQGVRYVHIHARNPVTGRQTGTTEHYNQTFEAVRNLVPGMKLGAPTSRKDEVADILEAGMKVMQAQGKMTPAEIAEVEMSRAKPALETADFLTIFTEPDVRNDADREAFVRNEKKGEPRRWPESVRGYFGKLEEEMRNRGISQELEITHPHGLNTIEMLYDEHALKLGGHNGKVHAVVLLGFSGELPVSREALDHALGRITHIKQKTGLDFIISVGAVIMPSHAATQERKSREALPEGKHDYREVIEWVVDHNRDCKDKGILPVSIFRTGLEDTPVLYGKQQTNAGLAAHARTIFAEHGVKIETNQEVVNDKMTRVQPEQIESQKLRGTGNFEGRLSSARSSGGLTNAVA